MALRNAFQMLITTVLTTLSLTAVAAPRTVFIQLFEWPWKDVARECEIYLGPAGFSAVQVSPPQEHVNTGHGAWWERYQVVSYKINSRGGTESDFADMVQRCHKAGVHVYADVILNHTAGFPEGVGFGGTTFTLFDYPGIYSRNDFHHCARNGDDKIVNYNDLYEMQNCMLVGLADLATESPYVRNKLAEYMNHLLDLGVDGFRIDAAKHIPAKDIQAMTAKLNRSPYIFQEIIYNPSEGVRYGDYTPIGDVTAYGYSYSVGQAFKNGKANLLYGITRDLPKSEESVVALTNHDVERNSDHSSLLSYSADKELYMLAQIYMLAWPYGYPQLYSGYYFKNYDQGPPLDNKMNAIPILDQNDHCKAPFTCEHRRSEIAAMVDFRNKMDQAFTLTNWWTNGRDQIAFGRGQSGFVAINYSGEIMTREFKTSLPDGVYCNIVGPNYDLNTSSCKEGYKIEYGGYLKATLPSMTAIVLMKRDSSFSHRKKLL